MNPGPSDSRAQAPAPPPFPSPTCCVTLLSTEHKAWHTFQVGCVTPAGPPVGAKLSTLIAHLLGRWGVVACLLPDSQIPVKVWLWAQPGEAFPEADGSGLASTQLWQQAWSCTASQTVWQRPQQLLPHPRLLEVGPSSPAPDLSWPCLAYWGTSISP